MKKYSFVISNKTYLVNDEKDLETLFKIFYSPSNISSIISWNILMEIDTDLEQIIVSYNWLLWCLKYLNEKNWFLLLVKLWDILIDLIEDSEDLAEILSRIPDEKNKIKLLNILRAKWLTKILFDAHDLGNIFAWLYGDSQREFIDLLGEKFIKEIFFRTNEIIMTLHYLTDENKDYLMNILWLEGTKSKIKTSKNLLVMFKWLTDKKWFELLEKFSKNEIFNMFRNDDEFYNFLLRLPENKEKIFLNYLKK